jgi:hypothetical protein
MRVIEEIIHYLDFRGQLTGEEIAYLRTEGFLPSVHNEEYDFGGEEAPFRECESAPDPEDVWEAVESQARAQKRVPRPRIGTNKKRGGGLRAADIRRWITERYGGWTDPLEPLLKLARQLDPAVSFAEMPARLHHADPTALLGAMATLVQVSSPWLSTLWKALQWRGYGELQGRGEAVDAYHRICTGADPNELFRYAWLLREDEVRRVHSLAAAQRRLLAACGQLYDTHFALIDRHLCREYRSEAWWPYLLLYNARRYTAGQHPETLRMGETAIPIDLLTEERFERFRPLATGMDPRTVRPYMEGIDFQLERRRRVEWLRELVENLIVEPHETEVQPLFCPQGWYKPY